MIHFLKKKLLKKYLIENNLSEINFELVDNLSDNILERISCICIVQHHDITFEQINEIYKKSKVPLIYDCQNKIKNDSNSKTILDCLGN